MSRTHDITISAFDLDRLERELATVTEQRDRAHAKIERQAERIKYLEGATNYATGTPLSKMREQRDMLAEACKLIMRIIGNPDEIEEYRGATIDEIKAARNSGNAALAAVKGSQP